MQIEGMVWLAGAGLNREGVEELEELHRTSDQVEAAVLQVARLEWEIDSCESMGARYRTLELELKAWRHHLLVAEEMSMRIRSSASEQMIALFLYTRQERDPFTEFRVLI